jgi:NAD-dependent deacetylase
VIKLVSHEDIRKAASLLKESQRVVAFTGAGISTESGIHDFRSEDGLWSRYDPAIYATIQGFLNHPEKYWTMAKELGPQILAAQPNPAHLALADLERMGKLRCVITQNIDFLHTRAGNSYVLELHGTYRTCHCLDCQNEYSREQIIEKLEVDELPPRCTCGGLIKSDTVLFGEPLPADAVQQAGAEARSTDLMIVVGSSLSVYPAAGFPLVAIENNAKLIIINKEPTPFDHLADVNLRGDAGEILPLVVDELQNE